MEQEVNKKKLFVASLSFKMRDNDLQEIFNTIGNVVNAKVVMNRDGRSKGYGFVEMASEEEAQHAIAQLNGTVHFGREIVVNPQLPKDQQQGYTTFRK
jgi:RNA recognition motif-containing protein